jgi:hypothetical protein
MVQKTGVYFTLTLNGKAKAVLLSSKLFDSLNSENAIGYQKSPFIFSDFLLKEDSFHYGKSNSFDKKLLEDFVFGQVIKIISDGFKEPVSARNAFFSSDFSIKISDYVRSLNTEFNVSKMSKDKKTLEKIYKQIQTILDSYDFDKNIIAKIDIDKLLESILDFMLKVA